MQSILYIVSGTITLVAALLVVTQRNVRRAAWFLGISCLGVAGVLVLLGAPLVAGVQLIACLGGIAFLPRLGPRALVAMTQRDSYGPTRRWWLAGLVALVLCGVLVWASLGHESPATVEAAVPLDVALAGLVPFALPLGVSLGVLAVALVGGVRIARKR
jgi:NADH:ubiquinone oxidoreductase subunit 6 (subunit J)